MLGGFEAILTVNFLILCLAIAGLTEVISRIVTFFVLDNPKYSATRTSVLWKNVILPSASIIIGISIALFSGDYAFPEGTTIFNGRIMFGIVAGLISGYVHRFVKVKLEAKITKEK